MANGTSAPNAPDTFVLLKESITRFENAKADIVLDGQGCVESWSDTATTLLGWTTDEACGRSFAELSVPPDLQALHTAGLARYQASPINGKETRSYQTVARRKDGRLLGVLVNVQIISDALGVRFLGWIAPVDGA